MTTRGEILDLLQSEEVLPENEIVEAVDEPRVTAALQGLADEGVLLEHSLLGHETYYSISDDVGRADIEQAAERVSAKEIAEQIVEESSILGDPETGTSGTSNLFRDLF